MKVACIGNGQVQQTKMSDKVGALNCMHDQQAVIYDAYQHQGWRENDDVQPDNGNDPED